MKKITLRILEHIQQINAIEELQRHIWPGSETDIVPAHLMLTAVHNGGLLIAAYEEEAPSPETTGGQNQVEEELRPQEYDSPRGKLVGFVFGFPGLYFTPDGPRLKHCSHMMGVMPGYRNLGIGFRLKRAQWQLVRHQGLDRITWTYDPLLSQNAHLNIARLGAVCNTYLREVYGEMRDDLNVGLPSDRFQVDWWVNSRRVWHRLSKNPRRSLDLAHFISAGIPIINPTSIGENGLPRPSEESHEALNRDLPMSPQNMLLVEIPADFQRLKSADLSLALAWRQHTRQLFETLFERGYLVTDFVHLSGTYSRSFYVLSHGESTL